MKNIIKIISIIGCFLNIFAMISVCFVDNLNILRLVCFLWISVSLQNNFRDLREAICNE